jgi:hypothetical protein
MRMPPDLAAAIDTVYKAFAKYRCVELKSSGAECVSDNLASELTEKLCSSPLRALRADDLLDYYYIAVEHVGTVEDLRYFLPRILELIASDPGGYLNPRLLPNVLTRAQPGGMADAERSALQNALVAAKGIFPDELLNESLKTLQSSANLG